MSDRQKLLTGRIFVVLIVLASWLLTLLLRTAPIFTLAVWCFSGFSALFPLVFAALYWQRVTKWGAYASIIAGIGSGIGFYIYNGWEHGFASRVEPEIWGMVPAAPMVIFAAIALVLVSWLTPPPSAATVDKFFNPRLSARENEPVGA